MRAHPARFACVFLCAVLALPAAAGEGQDEEGKPDDPDTGKSTLSEDTLGLLPHERNGVKLSLTYIGETLGNVAGGPRHAMIYEGRANGAIDVDFGKLAGWKGLAFHANVFQIHGRGLSRDYLLNLNQVSGVEARPSTRLYEAWFEQKFMDEKLALRVGQLAAEGEFAQSKYADVFINSTYNWPTSFAVNLPSGGPSPPLAAVGARARAELGDVTALMAIFNGDPAGPGPEDPQVRNRHGTNFRTSDSRLLLAELQYSWNKEQGGLPGTAKVGGWHHNGTFDDPRFASNGASQAAPGAPSDPAQLHADHAVYAVIEQMAMRFAGEDEQRGIGVFARTTMSPASRNLIDFYADGGVSVIGLVPSRSKDKVGLGYAYARISGTARDLDRDYTTFGTSPRPVRDHEALLTLSYSAQVRSGVTVLPTVQYIVHPGGGYVNDGDPPRAVKNATVLGLRMTLKF